MSKSDDALLLFEQGFSCSEAVFSVLTQDFRLNSDTALRILKGFGAGVACIDDICGALSGTIMVIGLRYGRIKADDKAAKEKTYAVVGEVLRRFMQ